MAMETFAAPADHQRPVVVIVGAGFAGLYCAKNLVKHHVDIVLIDRRNFHLFQPLLYQVASGSLSPGDIACPIRTEFVNKKNVHVVQAEVSGVDTQNSTVLLKSLAPIRYDYLVVATGAHHHYFGRDDWEQFAPGLKTIEDALSIRSRILHAFEEAEKGSTDIERSKAALTFIVVGAGPTGVELAGTIGELANQTMRGEFRRINPSDARVLLVENDNRVLPIYSDRSSAKAAKYLVELGVELKLGYRVTDVNATDVELTDGEGNTERIACRTVLWAAGNKASPLGKIVAEATGTEVDRAGRLIIDENLNVPGTKNLFVLGDLANFKQTNGEIVPGVAPAAMQQGKHAATNILRHIKQQPPKPFKYFNKGSLAVVGRNRAVAERGKLKFAGLFAWLMWAFIHIAYLIEFQNRVVVMFRWAFNYLSRKRGARLITGEGLPEPHDAEPSGVHPEAESTAG